MKRLLVVAVFLICTGAWLSAQGDLDEQQKVFFRNEKSFGLLLNSDGVGISYRQAQRIDYRNKRLFEFDLGTLKHPKEYKVYNPYAIGGGAFVYGKLNSVIFFRAGLGHQHEIYKKMDLGGVAVRYFYSVGPVISLYKPYYYKVSYDKVTLVEEKFDINVMQATDIYSKASILKGIKEAKILPGVYAKGGFNFEYSKEDKVIHAVEVGGQINAFPKKIPIMATSDNKAVFFSLFVSYRFGVIVDPLHPEETKLANLFQHKKKEE